MTKFPDLQTIVSNGLCTGCGLCESIAGHEQVKMALTSASRMRPQEKRPIDDSCMEKIRAICPGIALTGLKIVVSCMICGALFVRCIEAGQPMKKFAFVQLQAVP
jgi:hypothetical protein